MTLLRLAFGLIISAFLPLEAFAACARSYEPVEVRFRVEEGRISTRHDLSRAQLSTFAGRKWSSAVPEGFTDTAYEHQLSASIQSRLNRSGGCHYLRAVTLKFKIRPIMVYIAKEHPPGSCPYKVVRDHEDEHVAIFRSSLDEYLPLIEAKLERTAWAMKPSSASSGKRAINQFLATLQRSIDPILDRMEHSMRSRHAEIDTPRSYRMLSAQCDDW